MNRLSYVKLVGERNSSHQLAKSKDRQSCARRSVFGVPARYFTQESEEDIYLFG
jgi:hypothetical protein